MPVPHSFVPFAWIGQGHCPGSTDPARNGITGVYVIGASSRELSSHSNDFRSGRNLHAAEATGLVAADSEGEPRPS